MNVFLFELKRASRTALVWTSVLLAFLVLLFLFVYPVFLRSRADMEAALRGFPPAFAAAFGLYVDDIFSFGGFYAFLYLYLSLMGSIMAASLGLELFAREKRAKCTDFLLSKPVSRKRIFLSKLLGCLSWLAAMNLLFTAALVLLNRGDAQGAAEPDRALLAGSALFFMQIVILSLSVCAAVFFRRVRSVSGIAMAIAFAAFILTMLQHILEEEALRYVSPLEYFNVSLAFREGRFETPYVLMAAAVTALSLAASFVRYCRGDVRAA